MKSPTAVLLSLILASLITSSTIADSTQLCKQSADRNNYNSKFLKNFITLKRGSDNWLFRDYDLKDSFGPNKLGYKKLAQINNSLANIGTKLIIVPTPTRGITHPEKLGQIHYNVDHARESYEKYLNTLTDIGITVPELNLIYNRHHTRPLFFARDHHWTERGSKEVAKLTATEIKRLTQYPSLEKVQFSTVRTGSKYNNGSFNKASKKLCNTNYPDEKFYLFHTQPKHEVDMFSLPSTPQVVLVGTSNSNGELHFNFDGYLRQFTQVDILNMAESGSGYGGSLHNYLASNHFKTSPAKILIWEVPGYYALSSESYFNQILKILGESS